MPRRRKKPDNVNALNGRQYFLRNHRQKKYKNSFKPQEITNNNLNLEIEGFDKFKTLPNFVDGVRSLRSREIQLNALTTITTSKIAISPCSNNKKIIMNSASSELSSASSTVPPPASSSSYLLHEYEEFAKNKLIHSTPVTMTITNDLMPFSRNPLLAQLKFPISSPPTTAQLTVDKKKNKVGNKKVLLPSPTSSTSTSAAPRVTNEVILYRLIIPVQYWPSYIYDNLNLFVREIQKKKSITLLITKPPTIHYEKDNKRYNKFTIQLKTTNETAIGDVSENILSKVNIKHLDSAPSLKPSPLIQSPPAESPQTIPSSNCKELLVLNISNNKIVNSSSTIKTAKDNLSLVLSKKFNSINQFRGNLIIKPSSKKKIESINNSNRKTDHFCCSASSAFPSSSSSPLSKNIEINKKTPNGEEYLKRLCLSTELTVLPLKYKTNLLKCSSPKNIAIISPSASLPSPQPPPPPSPPQPKSTPTMPISPIIPNILQKKIVPTNLTTLNQTITHQIRSGSSSFVSVRQSSSVTPIATPPNQPSQLDTNRKKFTQNIIMLKNIKEKLLKRLNSQPLTLPSIQTQLPPSPSMLPLIASSLRPPSFFNIVNVKNNVEIKQPTPPTSSIISLPPQTTTTATTTVSLKGFRKNMILSNSIKIPTFIEKNKLKLINKQPIVIVGKATETSGCTIVTTKYNNFIWPSVVTTIAPQSPPTTPVDCKSFGKIIYHCSPSTTSTNNQELYSKLSQKTDLQVQKVGLEMNRTSQPTPPITPTPQSQLSSSLSLSFPTINNNINGNDEGSSTDDALYDDEYSTSFTASQPPPPIQSTSIDSSSDSTVKNQLPRTLEQFYAFQRLQQTLNLRLANKMMPSNTSDGVGVGISVCGGPSSDRIISTTKHNSHLLATSSKTPVSIIQQHSLPQQPIKKRIIRKKRSERPSHCLPITTTILNNKQIIPTICTTPQNNRILRFPLRDFHLCRFLSVASANQSNLLQLSDNARDELFQDILSIIDEELEISTKSNRNQNNTIDLTTLTDLEDSIIDIESTDDDNNPTGDTVDSNISSRSMNKMEIKKGQHRQINKQPQKKLRISKKQLKQQQQQLQRTLINPSLGGQHSHNHNHYHHHTYQQLKQTSTNVLINPYNKFFQNSIATNNSKVQVQYVNNNATNPTAVTVTTAQHSKCQQLNTDFDQPTNIKAVKRRILGKRDYLSATGEVDSGDDSSVHQIKKPLILQCSHHYNQAENSIVVVQKLPSQSLDISLEFEAENHTLNDLDNIPIALLFNSGDLNLFHYLV